jgi:hypothetical protein
MKRYLLLVSASLALCGLLFASNESDGCWRRRVMTFPVPSAPFADGSRAIENQYPQPHTMAKNDTGGTRFTTCGCITPKDYVYGQIFSDSNDIPDQIVHPLSPPNGSADGGAWVIVFSALAAKPLDYYTLRVSGTGQLNKPQSQDCPFGMLSDTDSPHNNPLPCRRQPMEIVPCSSGASHPLLSRVCIDCVSPDMQKRELIIRGRVLTTSMPKHTHGEAFRVYTDDMGQTRVKLYPAVDNMDVHKNWDASCRFIWVSIRVPVSDIQPGMQLHAALGYIPIAATAADPGGYNSTTFSVPR